MKIAQTIILAIAWTNTIGNIRITKARTYLLNPHSSQGELIEPGLVQTMHQRSFRNFPGEVQPPSINTANCIDQDYSCQKWAKQGECELNPLYMKTTCKNSCKVCQTQVAMFNTTVVAANSDAVLNLKDELKKMNESLSEAQKKSKDMKAANKDLKQELKKMNESLSEAQKKSQDMKATNKQKLQQAGPYNKQDLIKELIKEQELIKLSAELNNHSNSNSHENDKVCATAWHLDLTNRTPAAPKARWCDDPRGPEQAYYTIQSPDWKGQGFYKFVPKGRMAIRPEVNQKKICGTNAPIYLNYDEHPEVAVGQNVSALACWFESLESWSTRGHGCNQHNHDGYEIQIIRCRNDDLVYWLPNVGGCISRYCGVKL